MLFYVMANPHTNITWRTKKDNLPVISLPSSSSANASYSLEKLVCAWGKTFKER